MRRWSSCPGEQHWLLLSVSEWPNRETGFRPAAIFPPFRPKRSRRCPSWWARPVRTGLQTLASPRAPRQVRWRRSLLHYYCCWQVCVQGRSAAGHDEWTETAPDLQAETPPLGPDLAQSAPPLPALPSRTPEVFAGCC